MNAYHFLVLSSGVSRHAMARAATYADAQAIVAGRAARKFGMVSIAPAVWTEGSMADGRWVRPMWRVDRCKPASQTHIL